MTATTGSEATTKNLKDPRFYRHVEPETEKAQHPPDVVDHRAQGGPLLRYIWCSDREDMHGQELYLGAEIGCDGKMYCIPGHALRVLQLDPRTDRAKLIGPVLNGKYKWLRGIVVGDFIYGLPCHADTVLSIHVPTGDITLLDIPYDDFFENKEEAMKQRAQEWKYHGGNISPVDGKIYCIPQSASHVLVIDPETKLCSFFGPGFPGRYKHYGGVVGSQADGAIYGIPHNAQSVLRIHPVDGVTMHGDLGDEGHKWHGAARAPDGRIVCVPANADSVLCITPGREPVLDLLGDSSVLKSGRHRKDRKYKFLGAMAGSDGRVYCFPCASERVLAVDTSKMQVEEVGPNLYDAKMERICQNKYQNGVLVEQRESVIAIPLAAESVLIIDCAKSPPEVTTWSLPSPHRSLHKWEGAVVAPNGVVYTVPNNHKAILRIELPRRQAEEDEKSRLGKSSRTQLEERPNYRDDLMYKSGIPTLRASAHRVKFSPQHRKHNPKPKNEKGEETETLWLPKSICQEDVFSYDRSMYDLRSAVGSMLARCDPNIIGSFKTSASSYNQLEDFVVVPSSTWRTVNGGQCETAQKYLSEVVNSDAQFIDLFDRFVREVVLRYLKDRLLTTGTIMSDGPIGFYYQRPPTIRLQPGPAWAQVKAHNDAEYGHQNGELNFWVPLTDRELNGVDLWCETECNTGDYHPIVASLGEVIAFHGSSCRHYVNANATKHTRVSFDFRVGVQGFFDPDWEMCGTNDDHTRQYFKL
jgi:hypothetical protein